MFELIWVEVVIQQFEHTQAASLAFTGRTFCGSAEIALCGGFLWVNGPGKSWFAQTISVPKRHLSSTADLIAYVDRRSPQSEPRTISPTLLGLFCQVDARQLAGCSI